MGRGLVFLALLLIVLGALLLIAGGRGKSKELIEAIR